MMHIGPFLEDLGSSRRISGQLFRAASARGDKVVWWQRCVELLKGVTTYGLLSVFVQVFLSPLRRFELPTTPGNRFGEVLNAMRNSQTGSNISSRTPSHCLDRLVSWKLRGIDFVELT